MEDREIVVQLHAAGRGVTVLPDWLVAQYVEETTVRAIRPGAAGLHKKLYTATRK